MKEQLAERLLARVMKWKAETIAAERPVLQALARYKYDEYQQFSPGQKFIESLALWLNCMEEAHRAQAYDFVRNRLVFFSAAEMKHFVVTAYPYYIKPALLKNYALSKGISMDQVRSIRESLEFKIYQSSTLFLGLSDGAKTDVFRRANEGVVTHEQVLQSYEIREKRVGKLLHKLRDRIDQLTGLKNPDKRFSTVVLIDDFSASGTSYLRENESGGIEGKLAELAHDFESGDVSKLIELEGVNIILTLYVATQQALENLNSIAAQIPFFQRTHFQIVVVHPLPVEIRIKQGDNLDALLDAHYDAETMEDEHTKKGGSGIKYGYAGCGLPVVLTHNTPNNSIFPLWCRNKTLRPLFPRSIRHKAL